tara:strand:+ start:13460 stop:15715 length:2256 start_codon:yes stop_codon:yes gene_type:complete
MLRLTLWSAGGAAQYNIDLYENAPVNLNYQFSDVTMINKAKGNYSQTFRVPSTANNKKFFEELGNPTLQPTTRFNVKRKIRAELTYNSIPLMRGYIQIKRVIVQKKDFSDVEIIFFGETLELATELKEKKIADLTTTSIDHTLDYSTTINSMNLSIKSGNVVYGLMDKGRNWTFAEGQTPPYSSTSGLWMGDFTPYVRAKWLIDTIMSEAGFTYDSALFDSADFLKIYLPAYNGSITPRSDDNSSALQVAGAGLGSNFGTTSTSYVMVPLVDTASGGYDYSSNWNNTDYKWTAPYSCSVTFTVSVITTSGTTGSVTSQVISTISGTEYPALQLNGNGAIQHTINVASGEKLMLKCKASSGVIILNSEPVGTNFGTWLRIDSISEALQGQDVDMSANFPDIKQIDFLMGLQKMFNLVFIPDTQKPNHILIEPMQDYIATGTKKDWTNKIDYTKDVVITPTTDLQKNIFDWENTAGQDFVNLAIQESTGRVYGRFRIEDKDNDFATGDSKIQTHFAPYVVSNIPSSSIPIHRCIDKDGNGVQSPKARLAYFNGIDVSVGNVYVTKDDLSIQTLSFLPNFSNYNAINPTVTNNDLNFGYEKSFIFLNSHPVNTQYYRYWMGYVNELYSETSRLLTAYVKLNRNDIHDFEFSDQIFIKDTYYRILKISNYDATLGGVVKVDFIKILSDIADCTYLPTGQRTTGASIGAITFNGSSTNYGNQACCERYGYVWFASKSSPTSARCFPESLVPSPTLT